MAETHKLTREELEKIITEELGELDEGILSRMMAKMSATGSGAKASVGNIAKKVLNVGLRAFDAPELKMLNPKVVKQMTVLSNRLAKAGKQMNKIYTDIEKDLTKLVQGSDEKEVWNAANEIIAPALEQAKEASGAMMGVGAAFKKAIPTHSAKGGAPGEEAKLRPIEAFYKKKGIQRMGGGSEGSKARKDARAEFNAMGDDEKAGALAESKKQKKTVKIKVLKERKNNG